MYVRKFVAASGLNDCIFIVIHDTSFIYIIMHYFFSEFKRKCITSKHVLKLIYIYAKFDPIASNFVSSVN